MQFLKVAADGHAFGDMRAVVQLQHRHFTQRIDVLAVLGLPINGPGYIDVIERDLDAFFGQKDSDPAWIGCNGTAVYFHGSLPTRLTGPESAGRASPPLSGAPL